MDKLKAFSCLSIPVLLVFILNTKFGDLPPLLKFLDPFRGFWQNAENIRINQENSITLKGAKEKIDILFDEKMIPHIFANNDHDLYFAQGYVTAQNRLWQMDFQTRFAGGRIAEVVGDKALELDRYQRRMGMVYGAENSLKGMMSDPKSREMILAYTDGINAYIGSLQKAAYPLEFKLLDYEPELWTPIKCALLLKQMSAILAMGSDELYMANILKKYGPELTKNLFPDYPFREDPIIPSGTPWDFKPLPLPTKPPLQDSEAVSFLPPTKEKVEGIGSNNWALSGSKTSTGFPMLANDPHLELSLPSIWYQIQLHAPGINAYGVSLPGSPGIVIGYNEDIAWGVTNVGADVLDFYQIRFKDATHQAYWYDGKWKKTSSRIEKIKSRNGQIMTDTVVYTHHGPVVYFQKSRYPKADNVPLGDALRWIAHDQSNELRTFYILNRGKDYKDYRNALSYYTAPAQNFVFADRNNDISITANGHFPLKWKDQGKFILDGSKKENNWQGWIPYAQNPSVKNPPRGFVSSANQSSTDLSYPYYINWEFSATERGRRINQRLAAMKKATPDSLINMQLDDYSILAEEILPTLLKKIDETGLNYPQKKAFLLLKNWNKHYAPKELAPGIFELWNTLLYQAIWIDDFGSSESLPMRYPSRDRTVQLILNEPDSKWFDDTRTSNKETLPLLANATLKTTVDSLIKKYGPIGKNWQWALMKHTNIPHLAQLTGMGSGVLLTGGAKSTINALSERNGPSWRMVVALGKNPQGFGIFPGGQSGNPGSRFYDNMISTWSEGKLDSLLFFHTVNDYKKHIIERIKITP